jgi:NADH-quinone oxidoreductase subunit H
MHDFNFLHAVLTIAILMGVLQGLCAYLVLLERKIAAYVQDRIGPNRVGPAGLLQPLADALKFIFKEEIVPERVHKFLFILAPCIAMITATIAFAVVPFGPTDPPPQPPVAPVVREGQQWLDYQGKAVEFNKEMERYRASYQFVIAPGIDIGILFIFAITSLTVYAIILGGWSANNKYSFIGGLRSSAQIISYEIPMGMSVLGVVLLAGSLNLERIIASQTQGTWYIFVQPLAFLLFFVSALAETNRLPFDLPEAEQELIGGYHTEYNAWKLLMFFLGEYTHVVTTSFLMVILFFGGWHLPWIAEPSSWWLLKLAVFVLKVSVFIVFIMLIRWTIPRFRFDQLMGLAWKVLIPLALGNLVCVMVVRELTLGLWILPVVTLGLLVGAGWLALLPATKRSPLAA